MLRNCSEEKSPERSIMAAECGLTCGSTAGCTSAVELPGWCCAADAAAAAGSRLAAQRCPVATTRSTVTVAEVCRQVDWEVRLITLLLSDQHVHWDAYNGVRSLSLPHRHHPLYHDHG